MGGVGSRVPLLCISWVSGFWVVGWVLVVVMGSCEGFWVHVKGYGFMVHGGGVGSVGVGWGGG
jgi:hypothetical protein